MKIIVNADDLGHSTEVNDAIFDLVARGRITSSTLLANGPGFESAVPGIQKHKGCSFGAHLNLTEFRPLTDSPDLLPILDENGCFAGDRIRSAPITKRLCEAVFNEWCAQIERIVSRGVTPSHIDSHHHVHTVPGLFIVLKRVQQRFGIRKVRISQTIYPLQSRMPRALLLRKFAWNLALREYFRTNTSSSFTSLATFVEVARRQPLKCRSIELMVHPGTAGYDAETALLDQAWSTGLPFSTELISYHDL